MKIGAILPHIKCFGGVRRFLELANVFVEQGHSYTIYARKERKCDWFDFHGEIRDCSEINADCVLISYPPDFGVLSRVKGKVFVYVIAGGKYIDMYRNVYGKYPFIANNRVFLKYFPKAHLVEGGVNVNYFKPPVLPPHRIDSRTVVLFHDKGPKGGDFVKKELCGIENIELVGLKNLDNTQLLKEYQKGDFFVSWESREGWANMAAEAIACGLTVVGNGVNCEPFINKIIKVSSLRAFFLDDKNLKIRKSQSMREFSWQVLADKLLTLFSQNHIEQRK